MTSHLKRKHSEDLKAYSENHPDEGAPPVPAAESRKRGGASYTELYSLCPQKRRKELFQSTINDWVEAKTMLHFGSDRAQSLHKVIFEHMIMDNIPFYEANKPGFLRMFNVAVPNFNVACDTTYRSMLEPAYKGIR